MGTTWMYGGRLSFVTSDPTGNHYLTRSERTVVRERRPQEEKWFSRNSQNVT